MFNWDLNWIITLPREDFPYLFVIFFKAPPPPHLSFWVLLSQQGRTEIIFSHLLINDMPSALGLVRSCIGLGAQSVKHANVLSEKIISQPLVVQNSQFLEEMTLTHCILMSVIFRPHLIFRAFHICWDYVISFSEHFPMKSFHRHRHQSPTDFLKFG